MIMPNKTVVYYTSNKEDEVFEKRIRDNILQVTDLPIISVSQKPIDFGKNICVGKRGWSYLNAFRQLLIGCEMATTDFVVMAESDCLYPEKGYFDFEPTDLNAIYSYDNVWILNKHWDKFKRKEQTHGSMIYGRKWFISFLKECLKGLPMWSKKKIEFPFYSSNQKFQLFAGDPIINIITGINGRKWTKTMGKHKESLPYWGTIIDVKKKYEI